jgi:predicted Zn-dependent protease
MTRNRRSIAALTCLVALLGMLAGCRVNPVTGQKQLILVGSEQELAMGKQYHPNLIYMNDGRYKDPELQAYMDRIIQRLHSVSHRRDMPTKFTLLNSSIYNAFAIPGYIYATRGFVAELDNEAQFAAVMGHELAHVTALHTAKQMTNNMLTALGLGIAGQALGDSAGAQGVLMAGQIGVSLLGLSYSREQERQADRVGTYYMAQAGWDPREAVAMQKKLASLNKRQPTFMDRYLSTHPMTENRLQEIKQVIEQEDLMRHVQGDGRFADRWNNHLTELHRINEAYEPYDKGMELFQQKKYDEALAKAEEAISRRNDQAPFYRLKGDALLALERTDDAVAAYRQSLQRDGEYVLANIGLGRAALLKDDFTEAERQFATAVEAFPLSLNAQYGLGVARVKLQKYREAIEPLRTVTEAVPNEPIPHYYLAVAYDNTGQDSAALAHYRAALKAGLQGEPAARARSRVGALEAQLGAQQPTQ